ncbi:MAG TPA: preprotein translocase subunit SecG [Terrimicrobiaceae bacterium]|nr:preprotein translocase subunit SecG [Terrimicrobiaceae bacterium]
MWLLVPILLTIHVAICLLLVLVVLMQLPRSEGLGAAFGGGVTENIFGAQTTHVLAKFTVWLGVAFFVVTLMLAVAYSHMDSGKTKVQQELMNAPVPAAAASPAPSASPVSAPVAAPADQESAISAPAPAAPVPGPSAAPSPASAP